MKESLTNMHEIFELENEKHINAPGNAVFNDINSCILKYISPSIYVDGACGVRITCSFRLKYFVFFFLM